MRGRPPKKQLPPNLERAADAFVSGAEHMPESPSTASAEEEGGEKGSPAPLGGLQPPAPSSYPWEAPHVRDDVVKGYALRLPEPLYLRMKWTAEQSGRSMNQLCRDAIEAELARHRSRT